MPWQKNLKRPKNTADSMGPATNDLPLYSSCIFCMMADSRGSAKVGELAKTEQQKES